jgi:4-amino-4-deoxy-L-arabinose transferase-like glycosyltransferase
MVAGVRTFRIEDTFIEPAVLDPPPTRHALFVFLLALAALLHFATIGWGDLYSETEGQYAGAAREMLHGQQWLFPTNDGIPRLQKPPLLYWLIIASYKLFGINAAAARLPIAASIVATVALTFLIGERLTDYWRGFLAGLIYLCSSGTFLLGRIIMPEPLFAAFIAGAIFCGVCGYQRKQFRAIWFAGFWICSALACLTKGLHGLIYPASVFFLLALFYRTVRIRFRGLLYWPYLLLFIAIVAPWYLWTYWHVPGFFHRLAGDEWLGHLIGRSDATHDFRGVPRLQFVAMHLAWWFPWSIAILPGLIFSWRRLIRPHEIEFSDALPLCWMGVVFVPVLFLGQRQDYYSMTMWSALALWIATAWGRTPRGSRIAGAIVVGLIGVAAGVFSLLLPSLLRKMDGRWGKMDARWTAWKAVQDIPITMWIEFRPLIAIVGISLFVCALVALLLVTKQRGKLAVVALAAAMIPTGLGMIEGTARTAPYFSLAPAARYLNARLGPRDSVVYEGLLEDGSSLVFYLNRRFFMVNQLPEAQTPIGSPPSNLFLDEDDVLEMWGDADAIYLIVEQDRVPHWQKLLTDRFHIYHQITTCGTYVVMSNQL